MHQVLAEQVAHEERAGDEGKGEQDEARADEAEQQHLGERERGQGAQPVAEAAAPQRALLDREKDRQRRRDGQDAEGEHRDGDVQLDLPGHGLRRRAWRQEGIDGDEGGGQREDQDAEASHRSRKVHHQCERRGDPGHQGQGGEEVQVERAAMGAQQDGGMGEGGQPGQRHAHAGKRLRPRDQRPREHARGAQVEDDSGQREGGDGHGRAVWHSGPIS